MICDVVSELGITNKQFVQYLELIRVIAIDQHSCLSVLLVMDPLQ